MDVDGLRIDDAQAVAIEQLLERDERKVTMMLVVDRVECRGLDHPLDRRHFDMCNAIVRERDPDSCRDLVRIGHVRQNIVGEDDVSFAEVFSQSACRLSVEIFATSRNARGIRNLGNVARRIDAKHLCAARLRLSEEVAIVGGNLDYALVGLDKAVRQIARVRDHRV